MTTLENILAGPRDVLTVKRVFGEPIEKNGLLVLPVASVRGGGGGGSGTAEGDGNGEQAGEGSGGGFGVDARPMGVYVIRESGVEWQPAIDVTRLGIAAFLLAALMVLTIRTIVTRRRH